jgi:hypothetical protein
MVIAEQKPEEQKPEEPKSVDQKFEERKFVDRKFEERKFVDRRFNDRNLKTVDLMIKTPTKKIRFPPYSLFEKRITHEK